MSKDSVTGDKSGIGSSPIGNERQSLIAESLGSKITTKLFNGENYITQSQSSTFWLRSKSKFGYVDGTLKAPSREDPTYGKWKVENYLVMSWLDHSMEPSIATIFLEIETTLDIQDTLAQTYARKGNIAEVYKLRRWIETKVQGECSVLQYYTSLSTMWKRLDHLKNYRPICSTDATSFKEYIESERIFKFLASLNSEFDQVTSRILGIEPLPPLREAFAYVQNEESWRSAMLPNPSTDRSALLSSNQKGAKGPSYNPRRDHPIESAES